MKYTSLIILLLLLSCSNLEKTNRLSNILITQTELSKNENETLKVNWEPSVNTDWIIEDSEIICKLVKDTLKIQAYEGWGPTIHLNIDIYDSKYFPNLKVSNCTYNDEQKIISQSMILNKLDFEIGETIIGQLNIETNKSTILSGKFKVKIRSPQFNQDSLRLENKRNEILTILSQEDLENLKKLDLSKTKVTSLPIEFERIISIEELDLSNNDLKDFDFSELKQLSNLKILKLDKCGLNKIPIELFELENLIALQLWDNGIRSLPDELFNLSSLEVLNLGYNEIENLSERISNLENLESFDLSWNPIYSLPRSIYNLSELKEFRPPSRLEKYSEVVNNEEFNQILRKIKTDNNR